MERRRPQGRRRRIATARRTAVDSSIRRNSAIPLIRIRIPCRGRVPRSAAAGRAWVCRLLSRGVRRPVHVTRLLLLRLRLLMLLLLRGLLQLLQLLLLLRGGMRTRR